MKRTCSRTDCGGVVTGDAGITSNHPARWNRITDDQPTERLQGVLVQTRTTSGERGRRAESGGRGEERREWIAESGTGTRGLEARKPQCPSFSCNHYEYACGDSAAYKTGFHTSRATAHITATEAALSVEHHRLPNLRSPAQQPTTHATTPASTPSVAPRLWPLHPCSHTNPTNPRLPAQ